MGDKSNMIKYMQKFSTEYYQLSNICWFYDIGGDGDVQIFSKGMACVSVRNLSSYRKFERKVNGLMIKGAKIIRIFNWMNHYSRDQFVLVI